MSSSVVKYLGDALDSIANGKTVEFTWRGERVRVKIDRSENLMDGIRYILGGGDWQVLEDLNV